MRFWCQFGFILESKLALKHWGPPDYFRYCDQEVPKTCPRASKSTPRASQSVQELLKSVPGASKSAPRASQERPRAAQERPRAPKGDPRALKGGPRTPKIAQDGAKMLENRGEKGSLPCHLSWGPVLGPFWEHFGSILGPF